MIGDTFDNSTNKNLIIDFSQAKTINSCGLSATLIAHQMSNQSDGLLILSNLDWQFYIVNSIYDVLNLIEPAARGCHGRVKNTSDPEEEFFDALDAKVDVVASPVMPEGLSDDNPDGCLQHQETDPERAYGLI